MGQLKGAKPDDGWVIAAITIVDVKTGMFVLMEKHFCSSFLLMAVWEISVVGPWDSVTILSTPSITESECFFGPCVSYNIKQIL